MIKRGSLSYGNHIIDWDRFDEDRWILSAITSVFVLILAFIVLNKIRFPQSYEVPKPIEEIDFVKTEVKKKVSEPKKVQEKIVEQKKIDEDPEIVLNIFVEMPTNIQSLPQNLPASDEFKIFEHEDQHIEQSQAIMQITDGALLPESDIDPIEVSKGLASEFNNDNIKSTIITPSRGDPSLKENIGLSTTIRAKTQILSSDFSAFKGDIKWEEMLDPILDWINKNASPIGQIPTYKLIQNDRTAKTAKAIVSVNDVKYELLLGSKIEKKQITICLVKLGSEEYVMLVDQGLTKTSTIFNTGKVRRDDNNEIINFREGTYKNAKDPAAQEFMKIFWQWAKTVTGQG